MKKAVFPHLRGGVTRSFLLSYLLILLIPMTVFLLSNNKAIGTITENAASYHSVSYTHLRWESTIGAI